jgi:D-tyrosyl-tRNA(Tyr) deacylase
MKALIQRVNSASVSVENRIIASIGRGLLVFLGIQEGDVQKDLDYIRKKILNLRIFENEEGKFHYSLKDIDGELLLVSQFTLLGETRKGNRPSFTKSMSIEEAGKFYRNAVESFQREHPKTASGQFRAMMEVSLVNDGPVTLMLDSRE